MKQILTSLLLALMTILPGRAAQTLNGEWLIHSEFSGANLQSIVDTPSKVYFIANNCLYRYDKASGDLTHLSTSNGLHDTMPTLLSYNADADELAVAYVNCNIDFIRADGSTVNFPDIKNLVLTSSATKAINAINYGNGNVYIATSFGYVVADLATLSKIQSHILYNNIQSVAIVGSRIVMSYQTYIYYADSSKEIDALSQATRVTGSVAGKILPAGDNAFVLAGTAKVLRGTFADDALTLTELASGLTIDYAQHGADGFLVNCKANSRYYTLDNEGNNLTQVNTGSTVALHSPSQTAAGPVWVLDANGIYPRGTTAYVRPNALGISNRAWWMAYSPTEDKMYVSRTTDNAILKVDYSGAIEIYNYDGLNWANVTPKTPAGATVAGAGGTYAMTFIPSLPSTYFIATRGGAGTHKIVNGTLAQTFSSTTKGEPFYRRGAMALDSQGNLFFAMGSSSVYRSVVAIAAENLGKENIPASDIVIDDVPDISGPSFKCMVMAIGNNDTKVACSGDFKDPVVIWDSNADLTTNNHRTFNSFVDQDNITYSWTYTFAMSSDNQGNVWMGCNQGPCYFDPSQAFSDDFHINRVKEYDSQGNFVGYVLDGVQVNDITVDGEGRHWIATNDQGVTVLSADCKSVLRQFKASNSKLPTDMIYSLCYHPTRNSMFVMTSGGLVEFFINASTTVTNYDDTYVMPDPVRPDFTGWIEIKKLINNSRLTIVNADGDTVATLVADGGKALWDGCDSSGNRLPTGVYTVLAAPDDQTAPVPVTQVHLIK